MHHISPSWKATLFKNFISWPLFWPSCHIFPSPKTTPLFWQHISFMHLPLLRSTPLLSWPLFWQLVLYIRHPRGLLFQADPFSDNLSFISDTQEYSSFKLTPFSITCPSHLSLTKDISLKWRPFMVTHLHCSHCFLKPTTLLAMSILPTYLPHRRWLFWSTLLLTANPSWISLSRATAVLSRPLYTYLPHQGPCCFKQTPKL